MVEHTSKILTSENNAFTRFVGRQVGALLVLRAG